MIERVLLLPDEARRDFLEEVESELSGRSQGKWALLVVAFVAGAAFAIFTIARMTRDATERVDAADSATGASAP